MNFANMEKVQHSQLHNYRHYQTSLGTGIPMEPITAGIQAVGSIVSSVTQYFSVKKQVEGQIEISKIQADAQK